jgi:large subunit ribosomal protein L4
MLLPLKNVTGQQIGDIELSDAVFAAPVSKSLMHQALVRQLANARLGTHDTKVRWEVSGGGKKPWRQKGTGRARQGSIRASQWIGGGTAFGPTPRKYTQALPKKMQRAALRSALTLKAAAGQIIVVDEFTLDEPKTKNMVHVLSNLRSEDGQAYGSVLMVVAEKDDAIWRSTNNLPKVKAIVSGYINVRDLLGYDTLMLSQDAVEHIQQWLSADAPAAVEAAEGSAADDRGETPTGADSAGADNDTDRSAADDGALRPLRERSETTSEVIIETIAPEASAQEE